VYGSFEEIARLRRSRWTRQPEADPLRMQHFVDEWHQAVRRTLI